MYIRIYKNYVPEPFSPAFIPQLLLRFSCENSEAQGSNIQVYYSYILSRRRPHPPRPSPRFHQQSPHQRETSPPSPTPLFIEISSIIAREEGRYKNTAPPLASIAFRDIENCRVPDNGGRDLFAIPLRDFFQLTNYAGGSEFWKKMSPRVFPKDENTISSRFIFESRGIDLLRGQPSPSNLLQVTLCVRSASLFSFSTIIVLFRRYFACVQNKKKKEKKYNFARVPTELFCNCLAHKWRDTFATRIETR